MLLTNLEKKESCLYASFYCVLQGLVNCPTRGGIFTMPFHSTFLQPLFKQCVFGFLKNVVMGKEVIPCSFPAVR